MRPVVKLQKKKKNEIMCKELGSNSIPHKNASAADK